MRLKIRGNQLTGKVTNKCLNVREQVRMVESGKDVSLPSSAVRWIISVCERKP